jgi:hypothetical protein
MEPRAPTVNWSHPSARAPSRELSGKTAAPGVLGLARNVREDVLMRRFFLASFIAATLAAASPARAQSTAGDASSEDPLDTPDGHAIHTATVRLDPDPSLTLEALVDGSRDWEPVCTAPCGGKKRLDAMYRVSGEDIQTSAPFRLATGEDGVVDVHIQKVSKSPHTAGITLTIVGGVAMGAGAVTALFSLLAGVGQAETCDGEEKLGHSCTVNTDGVTVGLVMAGAGLSLLVTGLVLVAEHRHSGVDQDVASQGPPPSAALLLPHGREDDRSTSDAAWRVGAIESSKAFSIPVLGGTF